ncbi:hypothetical protein C7444_105110 [Sphaerotilus hippei]|uniref:ElaB/YqjD/DUF883 family membrane-anchored ribosome-binding protein n=1 Tax=Sphaerotilus hippei TaxID=744406 RepID=A0A318HCK7_9BURK|nr:hypothetical protein [Sphaerotilus hippei]PXW97011.1 hypothetical protein C7444_105110 [Sphaerotilus hippei]
MLNPIQTPSLQPASTLDSLAQRTTGKAEEVIQSTRRVANDTLDVLQDGVDTLRDTAPGTISRAAAQADELARRSAARVRQAGIDMRHQVAQAGERTADQVRREPLKSVLIAVTAGAALAAVAGWLSARRGPHA